MMSSGKRQYVQDGAQEGYTSRARLVHVLTPEANNFGLIRLCLALAVLVSHAYYLSTGSNAEEPLSQWTGHSLGEHAVQVFFFLSGLLVAQSLDHSRGMLDFIAGRVLRIFPGLAACVLVTACFLGPAVSTLAPGAYFQAPEFFSYLWRTLTLMSGSAPLPGVFETLPAASTVNMSLWTLKYEVFCYAGLAIAGAAGLLNPRWRKLSAFLLGAFVVLVFIEPASVAEGYTAAENVRYFALFFASGVLAYLVRDFLVLDWRVLAVLGLLFWLGLGSHLGELSTAIFLGYGALMAAALPASRLRLFTNRYDLSYGVYIYACPIQQLMVEYLPHQPAEVHIVLAVLFVMPLAFISWLVVERPAMRQRRRVRHLFTAASRGEMFARASAPPVSISD